MTTTTHKIIFFGSSGLSADILSYVLENGTFLNIVGIVTQPSREGAHAHQTDTPVARVAKEYKVPLFRPVRTSDCIEELRPLEAEAGLLFAYGQILKPDLLALFSKGIINIHPSLLPKYRGPSPIEAAILAGDTEVGTTIMKITEQMDAGPILSQVSFSVSPMTSKQELTQKLISASKELLLPTLHKYLAGYLVPQEQPDEGVTFCKLINKTAGQVSLSDVSATELERMIRAYAGWPGVSVVLPEKLDRLRIHNAHQIDNVAAEPGVYIHNKQLILITKDGTLAADQVQLPGRKILDAKQALNGLRVPKLPQS
ncbi:methionyl-tRNA formyltransferase [bacterium]|nr:methionyl-tRNA formyltransferase [bacterium]